MPLKIEKYKHGIRKFGKTNFSFIPNNFIKPDSIVYSFGAGEDIRWEIETVRETGCTIFLFDPTPKAKTHFEKVKACAKEKKEAHPEASFIPYNQTDDIMEKIKLYEFALWNNDEKVRFYEPANKSDVSHSITNLQKTDEYIEVQAYKIKTIMDMLYHKHIDFLKMDIEGSEFQVIDNIIEDGIDISGMCLEFHYSKDIGDFRNVKRLYETIQKMKKNNYKIIHRSTYKYFTVIKENESNSCQ